MTPGENRRIWILLEGSTVDFVQQLQDQFGDVRVPELHLHPQFGTAELRLDGVLLDVACARTETYPAPGENPVVQGKHRAGPCAS